MKPHFPWEKQAKKGKKNEKERFGQEEWVLYAEKFRNRREGRRPEKRLPEKLAGRKKSLEIEGDVGI